MILATTSFLESNDLRFGQMYSTAENYCSALSVLGIVFAIGFPTLITVVYSKSFRSIKPIEIRHFNRK